MPSTRKTLGLTQCEETLIRRALPVMQVYVKPGLGLFSYKSHTITLPHNVTKIAKFLPNLSSDLAMGKTAKSIQCPTLVGEQ